VNHPACFCDPERYPTPRELEIHFKVHNLRNTNCPEKGCEVTLDTLHDLTTHHTAHLHVEPRDKIICSLDNRLNLPDCMATVLNPFKTIRHALIYHIKTLRSYNNFIAVFPYLVTGNFEMNMDNDSYFTQESKYHIESKPIIAGNLPTGGDNTRGTGYIGNSFRAVDNTTHHNTS
jgi:hypothetical protein